jgi:hypothetical protein
VDRALRRAMVKFSAPPPKFHSARSVYFGAAPPICPGGAPPTIHLSRLDVLYSFAAQGFHGIYEAGAASGDQSGNAGGGGQKETGRAITEEVVAAHTKK